MGKHETTELGASTLGQLQAMKARHPLIADVRGLGLLLGVELVAQGADPCRSTELAEAVMYSCFSEGLSFKITMGNILTLTPALTIPQTEMDRALAILERAISQAESKTAGSFH